MKRRAALVLMFSLLAACTTSSAPPDPGETQKPTACADDLPASLAVSEGGLVTVVIPEGATYELRGGAVATADGAKLTIRAPYINNTEGDVGLTLSCGKTLAIELRPLAWKRLATWTEDTGAKAREYGAWWIDTTGTGALVVFGGFHYLPKQFTPANDAWRFDFASSSWSALAGEGLPTLPGGRAAPLPGERAVLFFGGANARADGSLETKPSLFRFAYDEARITSTPKANLGSVPGSYTGGFVHDSKRGRFGADGLTVRQRFEIGQGVARPAVQERGDRAIHRERGEEAPLSRLFERARRLIVERERACRIAGRARDVAEIARHPRMNDRRARSREHALELFARRPEIARVVPREAQTSPYEQPRLARSRCGKRTRIDRRGSARLAAQVTDIARAREALRRKLALSGRSAEHVGGAVQLGARVQIEHIDGVGGARGERPEAPRDGATVRRFDGASLDSSHAVA